MHLGVFMILHHKHKTAISTNVVYMSQHLRTLLTAPFPDSLSYAKQLFVDDERNFLRLCLHQVFFIESEPICVRLVFKIRTTSSYSNRISLKPIIRFSPCISPINASLFLVHYRWQCSCTKSFDVFLKQYIQR